MLSLDLLTHEGSVVGMTAQNWASTVAHGTRRSDGESPLRWQGRNAIISVTGPLMRDKALARALGGTWTQDIHDALDSAVRKRAELIVLNMASRGGTLSAAIDLAVDLRTLRVTHDVQAYAEELLGTAYLIGASTRSLTVSRGARVGAIGVATTVRDSSVLFHNHGIEVHVVKAGESKGVGQPGVAINADQLAQVQDEVDSWLELLQAEIAEARGRDLGLFDGRELDAQEAFAAGLVDQVGTLSSVVDGA